MTDEPKITLKVKLDNIFQMISNKVTSWSNTPSDDNYPSEKLVKDSLDNKASTDSVNSLGSTLSSNLSTIYNFIYNLTTDKVYDNGNLTNIGTTSHSTQELVNSKIDEKLGDLSGDVTNLDNIERISSTHSSSTSHWTGTSQTLTSLENGTKILYRLNQTPTTESKVAYLTLTLSNGNTTSEYTVLFKGATSTAVEFSSNSFVKNDVLLLEFKDNVWRIRDFFAIGYRPNVARTGSYNDLTNKPTIPSNTSDLNNNSGFITDLDIVDKEDVSNKVTDLSSVLSDDDDSYPTANAVKDGIEVVSDELNDFSNKLGDIDYLYSQIGNSVFNTDSVYGNDLTLWDKLYYDILDDKLYCNKRGDAYDEIATLEDIPSLTNYIQKSNIVGFVKNDGSIAESIDIEDTDFFDVLQCVIDNFDNFLYAPLLDGTETVYTIPYEASGTSINFQPTINNNQLQDGAGYLSDGWDNTVNWELTFEYYTTGDNNGYTVIPLGTDKRDYNGIQQWYNRQLNFYVETSKPSGYLSNAGLSLNTWISVKITKEDYAWKVYYDDVLKTTFDLSDYSSIVDDWTTMCIGVDRNISRNSARIRNIMVKEI